MMDAHENIIQFAEGYEHINEIIKVSRSHAMRFSLELLVFTSIVTLYSGIFTNSSIIVASIFVLMVIAGVVINEIYVMRHKRVLKAYKQLAECNNGDVKEVELYCNESIKVMKIGAVMTCINALTIGLAILLTLLSFFTLA